MIVKHSEMRTHVGELYQAGGLPKGDEVGWVSLRQLYTIGIGQWTLITGTPGSGKSEWLDAVMVNLAKLGGWHFIIYSPENWPLELHYSKILEKYIGKPFNPGPTERMDKVELDEGLEWMRGKFMFAKPEKPDILSILNEVNPLCLATRKTGLVIDPWNQLEHHRPQWMSETEYVSQTLTEVINWTRERQVHLWLVAHPSKMQKNKDGKLPVPTPHDVSGSAHFWNKADNCISIWRNQADYLSPDVQVHVQKVRFKNIGRIGLANLRYDRVTGQYRDSPEAALK